MADVTEIDEIVDRHGNVRRMGSLKVPAGFVSAMHTYEAERPVFTDAQIRSILQDKDRTPSRVLFGPKWRQNQQSHGSCNGYAGAGCLARARFLRGIQDGKLFSGAFLYSLMNGGRDQGSMLEDGLNALNSVGCCLESTVGWDAIYPNRQPAGAKAEAAKYKGFRCFSAQTIQGFKSGLAAGMIGVAAVQVGSRFDSLNQNGICGVDGGGGNHAVCVDDVVVVGGQIVFDMPNSWGLSFGDEGRGYLVEDHFRQTFGPHSFYLVPSTQEAELS